MAEPESLPSSGVDALVDRLREQGIDAGRREAARLVDEARAEADRMLAEARAEAATLREEAARAVERERTAALAALDLACRDALLRVREEIEGRIVRRLTDVAAVVIRDPRALENLLVDVTRHVLSQHGAAPAGRLSVHGALAADVVDALIVALTRDVLTEGVELALDARGGIRLELAGSGVEIEISAAAVSQLLAAHLLPRFRSLLEGHAGEPR
jgi:V/A-type H+-transporting ATPase subunit E